MCSRARRSQSLVGLLPLGFGGPKSTSSFYSGPPATGWPFAFLQARLETVECPNTQLNNRSEVCKDAVGYVVYSPEKNISLAAWRPLLLDCAWHLALPRPHPVGIAMGVPMPEWKRMILASQSHLRSAVFLRTFQPWPHVLAMKTDSSEQARRCRHEHHPVQG